MNWLSKYQVYSRKNSLTFESLVYMVYESINHATLAYPQTEKRNSEIGISQKSESKISRIRLKHTTELEDVQVPRISEIRKICELLNSHI